ncbi:hypothetical protein HAX54_022031 [Datura stramonium]|uniref:Uncharacterized protein n=1 Tax=Datura stramonium TaxID=4076 RepID=A0ABS8UTU3_DATST|nr:hypothetical protein [Datura stramonium]
MLEEIEDALGKAKRMVSERDPQGHDGAKWHAAMSASAFCRDGKFQINSSESPRSNDATLGVVWMVHFRRGSAIAEWHVGEALMMHAMCHESYPSIK